MKIYTVVKYKDETGVITSANVTYKFVRFGNDTHSQACLPEDLVPVILPCPFCGKTPDIDDPLTFQTNTAGKWGFIRCCIDGPETRAAYRELSDWKQDAIDEWNIRA